jgi:hypothetical protein
MRFAYSYIYNGSQTRTKVDLKNDSINRLKANDYEKVSISHDGISLW